MLSKTEWKQLPGAEFKTRLIALLNDPNLRREYQEECKKQWDLTIQQLKVLVAEREDNQRTRGKVEEGHSTSVEREQHHKDAPKACMSNDFKEREQHLEEQDTVIRKVAPEPSGFASFDEDLEEEVDTTNLKERVPKAHHTYLDIFSERRLQ